jgi:hypothetical protein
MTGPILQRPEGIRRNEIAAQMTVAKAMGTSIVNAIALSIVVPRLLGGPDSSFAGGQYRLKLAVFKPHWPDLI